MTEKKEILHARKAKAVRQTPQEDFGDHSYADDPEIKEEVEAPRRDLDQMSMTDLFAMVACAGVSKRLEDPTLIAIECYRIAKQMELQSERYKKNG